MEGAPAEGRADSEPGLPSVRCGATDSAACSSDTLRPDGWLRFMVPLRKPRENRAFKDHVPRRRSSLPRPIPVRDSSGSGGTAREAWRRRGVVAGLFLPSVHSRRVGKCGRLRRAGRQRLPPVRVPRCWAHLRLKAPKGLVPRCQTRTLSIVAQYRPSSTAAALGAVAGGRRAGSVARSMRQLLHAVD